jgi:hypothetical protein
MAMRAATSATSKDPTIHNPRRAMNTLRLIDPALDMRQLPVADVIVRAGPVPIWTGTP